MSALALSSFNATGPSAFSNTSSRRMTVSTDWMPRLLGLDFTIDNALAYGQYKPASRGGASMKIDRRRALAAGGALLSTLAVPRALRAQGNPIRIGSTLPLTGPLASLAIIHKVTADICV